MKNKIHQVSKWLMIFVAITLCSAWLTACGDSNGSSKAADTKNDQAGLKSVTIIRNFKTASLDPHNSWETLRAGITETLVRLNDKLELAPWLATQWEAEDANTWHFTIRDGVSFQDGTKLDAAAVKASFERGIAASGVLKSALNISEMHAEGQQLTIVTKEPHPSLPSELVNPYASIISTAAEKQMGTEAFNQAPVGTGPYKVITFTPNLEAELEANSAYWDGKPKLDRILYKFNEDSNVRALALQSGEADIVYSIPAESVATIEQNDKLHVESIAGLRAHYLLYNEQKKVMADRKVRQALDLLLDRDSIARDVMLGHGTPATGPFNANLPFGFQDDAPAANAEEALKLLEEAGFRKHASGGLEKDGKPLALTLATYGARPELPLIAQLLQSNAAKIGVEIKLITVENADTYIRENKDWDIVTYSNLTAPRGDGGYFLNSAFMPGGALNGTEVNDQAIAEVVHKLNAATDVAERVQLTKEAAARVLEQVHHSYVVYPNLIVGVNDRIADWKPGAEEYYIVTAAMDVS